MTEKKEIIWNIVNAGLAGILIFLGACIAGNINLTTIIAALIAAAIVAITNFKNYWAKEEDEYTKKIFNFLNF